MPWRIESAVGKKSFQHVLKMKVAMQKARPNLSVTPSQPCSCLWPQARLPYHAWGPGEWPQQPMDGPDISPSSPGGKGTSARGHCGPMEKLVAVVSPAPSHHPDLVQCLDSAQVPCRGVSSGH